MVFKRAGFKTLPSMKVVSEIAQALDCPPGTVLTAFLLDLDYLGSEDELADLRKLVFIYSAMGEDERAALVAHAEAVARHS